MTRKTKHMLYGRQLVGSDREDQAHDARRQLVGSDREDQAHGGWEAGGGQ